MTEAGEKMSINSMSLHEKFQMHERTMKIRTVKDIEYDISKIHPMNYKTLNTEIEQKEDILQHIKNSQKRHKNIGSLMRSKSQFSREEEKDSAHDYGKGARQPNQISQKLIKSQS